MSRGDFAFADRLRVLYPDASPAELARQHPCPHKSGLTISTAACCVVLRRYLATGVRAVPTVSDDDLDDLAALHAPDFDVARALGERP